MTLSSLLRRTAPTSRSDLRTELERCAAQVLLDWTRLQTHAWVEGPVAQTHGSLHVSLTLEGPRRARLVLSSSMGLGALLAVAGTGDPGASGFAVEALLELARLLREPLLQLLQQDGRDCLTDGPRLANAKELPSRPATVDRRVGVGAYPLRLRLWVD
jgi:hypothetical protein